MGGGSPSFLPPPKLRQYVTSAVSLSFGNTNDASGNRPEKATENAILFVTYWGAAAYSQG
jgi:hypothetical protein